MLRRLRYSPALSAMAAGGTVRRVGATAGAAGAAGGRNCAAAAYPRSEGSTFPALHSIATASRARGKRARNARDRKSTRLNSSHVAISYAVFCLKKKKQKTD